MKNPRPLIILLIVFSLSIELSAQNSEIDSLENLIETYTEQDTVRVKLLNKTAYILRKSDKNRAIEYAEQAKKLADSLSYSKGKAMSLSTIGLCYLYKADYDQALENYLQALELREQLGNKNSTAKCLFNIGVTYWNLFDYQKALEYYQLSLEIYRELDDTYNSAKCLQYIAVTYRMYGDYNLSLEYYERALAVYEDLGNKQEISKCFVDLGVIHELQGNYFKALEYYQNALRINEELENSRWISACLNNIGLIYWKQENYSLALDYYQRSLVLSKELEDKQSISNNLNNIGIIYKALEKYPKALEYYQESLDIREAIGSKKGISECLNNIGSIHVIQDNDSLALDYFQKSLLIREEIKDKPGICAAYLNIGSVYLETNNYSKALDYTVNSLKIASDLDLLDVRKFVHEQLAKIYTATGNYNKAYENHVLFKELNDSIFNEKNIKKITELENQYEFEKERQAIELEQQKKDAVYNEQVKRQKAVRNYLWAGLVLMGLLALVVLRSSRQKRKANFILTSQKKNIEEKNSELLKLNKEIQDQSDLIQLNTKLIIKLENDKHEMELASRKKDLEALNINNQLKIKMKDKLIKELQSLKKTNSTIAEGIQPIIQKLKQQVVEETKRDLLQSNIEVIGSEFNERIKQKFPVLSHSEIELLSFIKLKMSNKQIAIQKNTSPNTINVALHRLKAKCNFESTNELKDFIEGF